MDGVVADFNLSYRDLIMRLTDLKLPEISDTYPDTWYYCRAAGVTKEQEKLIWGTIANSKTFWLDLKPYKNASTFLYWLSTGFRGDAYFITQRPGATAKWQTEKWLKRHGYLGTPTVLVSGDKGLICKALKVDYYVDDKTENCANVLETSANTLVYMIDRAYNQPLDALTGRGTLEGFRKLVEGHI